MGLPEVSTILWRERNLLELLLFKLEEERLVLAAGLGRWLPQATREVELVRTELQRIQGPRTAALEAAAAELGLEPGRSLGEVAAAAPPPWDGLLDQHRAAFAEVTRVIEPLVQAHRGLLGTRETEAAIAWLDRRAEDADDGTQGTAGLRLLPHAD